MMNMKMTVLTVACALVLSACGNSNNPSSSPAPASEPAPAAPAPTPTEAPTPMAAMGTPDAAPAANSTPAAAVTDCRTEIEGNDLIQYNVSSIVVPSSCTDFKITLKHTGKLPVTAMGHDVVITKASDMAAVDADGIAAGAAVGYVKPGDTRVIAHTSMVGGGETTSVSFPVSKIQGDGPYKFFCSFPGHSGLMNGSISVQ